MPSARVSTAMTVKPRCRVISRNACRRSFSILQALASRFGRLIERRHESGSNLLRVGQESGSVSGRETLGRLLDVRRDRFAFAGAKEIFDKSRAPPER